MVDGILYPFYALCSTLYCLCVLGLTLHAVGYGYLYWLHRFRYVEPLRPESRYPRAEMPFQIIQLPVYNEDVDMVKRLAMSACDVDYPHERLLVQLLDDSDDPTIAAELRRWAAGISADHPDIELTYHHRSDRRDFKAGNLNTGLAIAQQSLEQRGVADPHRIIVSIFDADFIVPGDYLNQVVHHFSAPDVGAVQAALTYYNQDENLLTQAQAAFMTNLHTIDFGTRSRSGHLTTYRGSAGSWRLATIESAGGWQGDTQVEDVDMSFAAQLNGWRIVFLDHLQVACQLPMHFNAFKLQQRSWMKGLMEVFRKWGRPILTTSRLSVWQKAMAYDFFLILTLQALFVILGHLMIIPTYLFLKSFGQTRWLGGLTIGLLILFCFTHFPMLMGRIGRSSRSAPMAAKNFLKALQKRLVAFGLIPSLFPVLTYGLLEGLVGVHVHRDRTVKSTDARANPTPALSPGQRALLARIMIFEIAMSIYSLMFVFWAAHVGEWLVGGILSCFVGFYTISAWSTAESFLSMRIVTNASS